MNITYDDAYERSADEPAFSNGTEGYDWMENWCARCSNDGYGLGKDEPQCPLILIAMLGRTPAEWMDQKRTGPDGLLEPYGIADQYHCIEFRDRDDPGGREPEPVPDPPGQLLLLPREPYEAVRMYADTKPVEVPA